MTRGGAGGGAWVSVFPPPPLPPHLLRRSAAGEEVAIIVAVQGDVEHSWVAVESLLGAIAVVDVLQTRGGHTTQQHNTHDPPPPCPPSPQPGSPHPIHDEDAAHAQLLLQQFG